jgi:hypothetical protein
LAQRLGRAERRALELLAGGGGRADAGALEALAAEVEALAKAVAEEAAARRRRAAGV